MVGNNPSIEKMADVMISGGSIFSSAWFWLLLVAIFFFIVGIVLLATVGTGWGVFVILLGVIFLIVAGVVGFVSSSRRTALDLLATPAGQQLAMTAVGAAGAGPPGTSVTRQVTEVQNVTGRQVVNVPITRQVTEYVPVTRNVTTNQQVVRPVTIRQPITRTETVTTGQPLAVQAPPVVGVARTPTVTRAVMATPVGTPYASVGPPLNEAVPEQAALANLRASVQPTGRQIGGF